MSGPDHIVGRDRIRLRVMVSPEMRTAPGFDATRDLMCSTTIVKINNSLNAAWLAREQNTLVEVAMQKLGHIKDAFEEDPDHMDKLNELERILEDMQCVNRATLMASRARSVRSGIPGMLDSDPR